MRTISSLLKTRIPIRNRWFRGISFVALLVVFAIGFLDLSATIARGVFGEPSHPVAFWLATFATLILSVWFFYIIIDEWQHGPRQKRKRKDEHDA